MTDYVDDKAVQSFTVLIAQGFTEAIEFAVEQRRNMDESNIEEERQAAQDALMELTRDMVSAVHDAYRKSPLADVDYSAVATVFEKLAVRAKVQQYAADESDIVLSTRKGSYHGTIVGRITEGGEDLILVSEGGGSNVARVPEVSVVGISA